MEPQLRTTAASHVASRHAAPLLWRSRAVTVRDYKIALGMGAASGVLWYFVLTRVSPLPGDKILILAGSLPFLFVTAGAAGDCSAATSYTSS